MNSININPPDIGKNVKGTTTFLKRVSDYIESKLYNEEGNVKEGGVKSLSLTFAMLVGFSMAIVVLSSIFITLTISHKNSVIDEYKSDTYKLEKRNIELESKADYWKDRYSNVYSQCDSIGYERARQALEFSQSLNNKLSSEEKTIKSELKNKSSELKDLKSIRTELSDLKEKITLNNIK